MYASRPHKHFKIDFTPKLSSQQQIFPLIRYSINPHPGPHIAVGVTVCPSTLKIGVFGTSTNPAKMGHG